MVNTDELLVYGDMMSQPTRAVVWLCKLAEIPYTFKIVRLAQKEHTTAEYRDIHPFSLVPSIKKGEFKLFESHAILQFLADSYRIPEHFYPRSSLEDRSLIDEYLHWHHFGVRQPCVRLLLHQWLGPMRGAKRASEETLKQDRRHVRQSLERLNNHFLNHSKFINGRNEMSIADLSAFCEIKQLEIVQLEDIVDSRVRAERYPNLDRWIQRMENEKHYESVYRVFNMVKSKIHSRL